MIEWKGALNGKPNTKLHKIDHGSWVILFYVLSFHFINCLAIILAKKLQILYDKWDGRRSAVRNQLNQQHLKKNSDRMPHTRAKPTKYIFRIKSLRRFLESNRVLIKMNYTVAIFFFYFCSLFGFLVLLFIFRLALCCFIDRMDCFWNIGRKTIVNFSSMTKRNGKLLTRANERGKKKMVKMKRHDAKKMGELELNLENKEKKNHAHSSGICLLNSPN